MAAQTCPKHARKPASQHANQPGAISNYRNLQFCYRHGNIIIWICNKYYQHHKRIRLVAKSPFAVGDWKKPCDNLATLVGGCLVALVGGHLVTQPCDENITSGSQPVILLLCGHASAEVRVFDEVLWRLHTAQTCP